MEYKVGDVYDYGGYILQVVRPNIGRVAGFRIVYRKDSIECTQEVFNLTITKSFTRLNNLNELIGIVQSRIMADMPK